MLLGIRDVFFLARLTSFVLTPWCIMIEQSDTTRPAMVTSEPSETVKEHRNK